MGSEIGIEISIVKMGRLITEAHNHNIFCEDIFLSIFRSMNKEKLVKLKSQEESLPIWKIISKHKLRKEINELRANHRNTLAHGSYIKFKKRLQNITLELSIAKSSGFETAIVPVDLIQDIDGLRKTAEEYGYGQHKS